MEYLRGKIKARTPALAEDLSSESWRARSSVRRRDEIYSAAYSRLPRLAGTKGSICYNLNVVNNEANDKKL